jgi:hypothetical protein
MEIILSIDHLHLENEELIHSTGVIRAMHNTIIQLSLYIYRERYYCENICISVEIKTQKNTLKSSKF